MAVGSIEIRGKESYRLVVSNGYDKEGRRIRHRKTIKAKSDREAEKELTLFVAEIEKGEYIEPSKLTFKEFAEEWLEEFARHNLKTSTIHGYEEMLRLRIYPAIGHIPISKLNARHLQKFYSNLTEDGVRLDGKPGGLNPRTIRNHHTCISAILRQAKKWEIITTNVALNADPPKISKKDVEFYDEKEVKHLLEVIKKEAIKYFVLITLAITTGLRKSELLGLRWNDINFESMELTVRETIIYRSRYGVYKDSPKSEMSKRTISISDVEINLLKQFKRVQDLQKEKVGEMWEEHNKIFTQWNGKPMHPNTVYNKYAEILKDNNIPKKSFHSLRHSNITLMLAMNVDLMTVIHRGGHSNEDMPLKFYGHPLKSQDKKAAQVIKEALF